MRWYDSIMNNLRIQSADKTEDLIRETTVEKLAAMIANEGRLELVVEFDFGTIFQECTVEQIATWLKKELPYSGRRVCRATITKEEADI